MKLFVNSLIFFLLFILNSNAQWQPTNGPEGGTITGFVEKDGYIFASEGNYNSGSVYRTSDNGGTWEYISSGLPISKSILSPTSNQSYIFIGTKSEGVYRSSDLGITWEQVSHGIPVAYAPITSLNTINDTLLAGTYSYGMYKTTNNGNDWIEANNGLSGNAKIIRSEYILNNIVYIGTDNGLYKSTDFGNSWIPSGNGITSLPVMSICSQDNYLFALGLNVAYRSSDNGNSWQPMNAVAGPNSIYSFGGFLYIGSYNGIYRSSDYGLTWEVHNSGLPQYPNIEAIYKNNSAFLISLNELGIYASTDNGDSWFRYSEGIQNTSPTCFNMMDNNLYSGTRDADYGLVWQYDLNNNLWTMKADGLSPMGCNALYNNSQYIFAGTDGSGVFRSSDNGLNWEQAGSQFLNGYINCLTGDDNYVFIGQFAFAIDVYRSSDNGDNWVATSVPGSGDITFLYKNNNYIFTGRTSGVYRTSDDGITWTAVNNGLQSFPFASSFAEAGNFLFVTCSDGLYRSSNNGDNWVKLTNFPNYQIYSLINNRDMLFAGTRYNGILYSSDFGESWYNFSTGMPINLSGNFPSVRSLQVYNNNLYAGLSRLGVWVNSLSAVPVELVSFAAVSSGNRVQLKWTTATESNNKGFEIERKVGSKQQAVGNKWQTIGFVRGNGTTAQPNNYSFQDGSVQEGTYQYRLKQIDFDGSFKYSDIVEVLIDQPAEFSLFQNYPNPFNPTTKISWQSPVGSWQTLKIYDVLGNEVKTLVNEFKPAGKYEVEFDGSNLASGIYFYRLTAGKFSAVKKLILVK